MPAFPRKTAKVFGATLIAGGNIAQPGSGRAGTPVFSNDLAVLQGLAAWGNALNGMLIGNESPSWQEMNGLLYTITAQLAYLLQSGTPEYDPGTTYFIGNICRAPGTSTQYTSLTNDNTGNALADTNNWQPLLLVTRAPTLALAWAVFDGINVSGGNARLINAFNVASVTKAGAGDYTLQFQTPLPGANYGVYGSCGTEDGAAYGPGDDGIVVGNLAGQGAAVRNANSCRIFTINPTNKALVQSGCVSAIIFGS